MEKLVDILHGFTELSSTSIPMFKTESLKNYKHLYHDKAQLGLDQTYERLIVNQQ
jgi:hypothetical protein